jgi:hypothetical protein
MNRRALITAAIPLTLLAVNPPSCTLPTTTTTTTSAASNTVTITADGTVCWKADIDDRGYSYCGDKTLTFDHRTRRVTVWKTNDVSGGIGVAVWNGTNVNKGNILSPSRSVTIIQN